MLKQTEQRLSVITVRHVSQPRRNAIIKGFVSIGFIFMEKLFLQPDEMVTQLDQVIAVRVHGPGFN
ncbi:MAG: hypothetical protein B7Y12_04215 [Rhizobiales bacterium 24-66-13]|nr:MAG: hypothetical protein B7Y61_02970 [Rhizobiales bacterium 35-66-30]OYZ82257.1 MAG: hypothetical protein B7Y12_04215 [Rhizobiales bacterium 24-66-13]OZB11100.1 MAG: hypothetical protein B7X67_05240 [Rhizobiales bacterium 39-66-18]